MLLLFGYSCVANLFMHAFHMHIHVEIKGIDEVDWDERRKIKKPLLQRKEAGTDEWTFIQKQSQMSEYCIYLMAALNTKCVSLNCWSGCRWCQGLCYCSSEAISHKKDENRFEQLFEGNNKQSSSSTRPDSIRIKWLIREENKIRNEICMVIKWTIFFPLRTACSLFPAFYVTLKEKL